VYWENKTHTLGGEEDYCRDGKNEGERRKDREIKWSLVKKQKRTQPKD
jgi:hypothetical protein